MNKVLSKAVAFLGMGVAALSACGSSGYTETEYVYVHGYYDSYHHYHSYPHGKRVTVSYYNHHKSSYPKPYKTTKVKVKPKTSTSKSKVNKLPKLGSKKTSGTTKKSGGYSYKKRR